MRSKENAQNTRIHFAKFLLEYNKPILVAVFLFLLTILLFGITKMPANDMQKSINKDNLLFYRKFWLRPDHGQIVVYAIKSNQQDDSVDTDATLFIQRCIALPGDSILIDSGKVYVNNKCIEDLPKIQKNYILKLQDSIEKIKHIEALIIDKVLLSKKYEYATSLPKDLYFQLLKDTNVISIHSEIEKKDVQSDDIYPYDDAVLWNKHFFGPIYLPKKGDSIIVSKNNIQIYFPLIQNENKNTEIRNDSLIIDKIAVMKYHFKNDYYFVLGDNRDNAIDSRYFGPVAYRQIKGIVFYSY